MENKAQIVDLIAEMKQYLKQWDFDLDENIDLEDKYSQRVKEVGEFNFVVCLFENYSNSSWGMTLMRHFLFVWKDFNYQEWKKIFYIFANNSIILYELIWFYGNVLGINIGQIIQEDKQVTDQARNFLKMHFPKGTPKGWYPPDSLEENNIKPLWKRLKEQGAPMNVDI